MNYHVDTHVTWVDPNQNDPTDTGESIAQKHKWICPGCGHEMEIDPEMEADEEDYDDLGDDDEYEWDDPPITIGEDDEGETENN